MRLAELVVPARPEFASLLRLVVSSTVSSRYDISDEKLDDLKLAVAEACLPVLAEGDIGANRGIALICTGDAARLDVTLDSSGYVFAEGVDLGGDGLGLSLVESLVDEVAIEDGHVRLTLQAPFDGDRFDFDR